MLTAAIVLNNSPARCDAVPVPYEAILILPGLPLAWAINSLTFLAGTDGCTAITKGRRTKLATGAMSRRKLKPSFSKSVALIAFEAETKTSVYPSGGELIAA